MMENQGHCVMSETLKMVPGIVSRRSSSTLQIVKEFRETQNCFPFKASWKVQQHLIKRDAKAFYGHGYFYPPYREAFRNKEK